MFLLITALAPEARAKTLDQMVAQEDPFIWTCGGSACLGAGSVGLPTMEFTGFLNLQGKMFTSITNVQTDPLCRYANISYNTTGEVTGNGVNFYDTPPITISNLNQIIGDTTGLSYYNCSLAAGNADPCLLRQLPPSNTNLGSLADTVTSTSQQGPAPNCSIDQRQHLVACKFAAPVELATFEVAINRQVQAPAGFPNNNNQKMTVKTTVTLTCPTSTPSNSVKPTSTPSPNPSKSASPKPSSPATPTPPYPSPPIPPASPSPSASPSPAASPSDEPEPTSEPSPSDEPEPTNTPSAEPSSTPEPSTSPSPSPRDLSKVACIFGDGCIDIIVPGDCDMNNWSLELVASGIIRDCGTAVHPGTSYAGYTCAELIEIGRVNRILQFQGCPYDPQNPPTSLRQSSWLARFRGLFANMTASVYRWMR